MKLLGEGDKDAVALAAEIRKGKRRAERGQERGTSNLEHRTLNLERGTEDDEDEDEEVAQEPGRRAC